MTTPRLEISHVSKVFRSHPGVIERGFVKAGLAKPRPSVHALDDVTLTVGKGQIVGLVGESGCGKSTLGRVACGLLPQTSGAIRHNGAELSTAAPGERRAMQLGTQMIFQDPSSSLNPRMRVRDIVGEAPRVHGMAKGREIADLVDQYLELAGIDASVKNRFPHQFSGGQRQRIGIARALAVKPDLLVCDESVAALDVSIQAQILNLFLDLREQLGLTYLFISHDLSVVRHISDRVAVMYLGRLVEEAATSEIFENPKHPYTQALLEEIPELVPKRRSYGAIKGEIPSPLNPPSGCHFHPRCPFAMERCRVEVPQLRDVAPGHRSACHLND
ncbi:ABC transporter ATP-binding protein [Martelella sp. FOR1707]